MARRQRIALLVMHRPFVARAGSVRGGRECDSPESSWKKHGRMRRHRGAPRKGRKARAIAASTGVRRRRAGMRLPSLSRPSEGDDRRKGRDAPFSRANDALERPLDRHSTRKDDLCQFNFRGSSARFSPGRSSSRRERVRAAAKPATKPAAPQPRPRAARRGPRAQPQAAARADEGRSRRRAVRLDQGLRQGSGRRRRKSATRPAISARRPTSRLLALAVYDVKGDDTKIVRFLMPLGLMLRPGFRFAVDKGARSRRGDSRSASRTAASPRPRSRRPIVDSMKKGEKINDRRQEQVNDEVTFVVPLEGFGKAFDGPAIDPKVLEEQQKQLQERAAEEGRGRAQEARGPEAGAQCAAPAPAPCSRRAEARLRLPRAARKPAATIRSVLWAANLRVRRAISRRERVMLSGCCARLQRDSRRRPCARRSRRSAGGAPDRPMCPAARFCSET